MEKALVTDLQHRVLRVKRNNMRAGPGIWRIHGRRRAADGGRGQESVVGQGQSNPSPPNIQTCSYPHFCRKVQTAALVHVP